MWVEPWNRVLNICYPTTYSLGAALVVDYHVQSTVSKTYLQTIYNPLCPIRYENTTEKPDDWKNVSGHLKSLIKHVFMSTPSTVFPLTAVVHMV